MDIPAMRPRDGDETEWQSRMTDKFGPLFDALVHVVDTQSPFYPNDIYRAAGEAVQCARICMQLAWNERPQDYPDFYKERRTERHEFESKTSEISELMRKRLASLEIVETAVAQTGGSGATF
jgi:hypothetical protein